MLRRLLGLKKHPDDIVDKPPVRFPFAGGTYHAVFERKVQPDAGGAANYAWESLDLAQFTPIGAGTAVRRQLRPTQPGGLWFEANQVWANGIPTRAGQLGNAPLIDPGAGGYVPPDISLGYPDSAGFNLVRERALMTHYNDPNPYAIRKGL
jgi:hypothetical protein